MLDILSILNLYPMDRSSHTACGARNSRKFPIYVTYWCAWWKDQSAVFRHTIKNKIVRFAHNWNDGMSKIPSLAEMGLEEE